MYGSIVCGDGTRHRVDNTEELRTLVLDLAQQIRAARARLTLPIAVDAKPAKCRPSGMRSNCTQAKL
jgi:hypothetical protein